MCLNAIILVALAGTVRDTMTFEVPSDSARWGEHEMASGFLGIADVSLRKAEHQWWNLEERTGTCLRFRLPTFYADCGLIFEGELRDGTMKGVIRPGGMARLPPVARLSRREGSLCGAARHPTGPAPEATIVSSAHLPDRSRLRSAHHAFHTGIAAVAVLTLTLPLFAACASTPVARDAGTRQADVEAVVADSFFGAVTRMDEDAMRRSATPTFDLQSDSARLDLDGYIARVRRVAERGGRIEYVISEPRTQVHGDVAWTTYRSRGNFIAANGPSRWIEWMETAVLVRDARGRWRLDRLHSATVARSP